MWIYFAIVTHSLQFDLWIERIIKFNPFLAHVERKREMEFYKESSEKKKQVFSQRNP